MNEKASLKQLASARGMTLIEIMVVIAIIGILSTAIGFGVVTYLNKAKVDACKAQISRLSQAVDLYAAENDYPTDLRVLVEEKIVKENKLLDPWKQDLLYNYPARDDEKRFDLCSKGPDKVEGSEDDVCND